MIAVYSWAARRVVRSSEQSGAPRPVPALVLGDLSLVRPVAEAGIDVHLGWSSTADPTRHSRLVRAKHPLPSAEDPTFGDVLLRLGARLREQYGRRVPLYYGTDAQLDAICQRRTELACYFVFLMNEPDLSRALLDKLLFHRLCKETGVAVPLTLGAEDDLEQGVERISGPLLVKPRTKIGWHHLQKDLLPPEAKARVYPDSRALLADGAVARHRGEILVQECVPAGAGDLCSFHGFADEGGALLSWFCGRKIRTYPTQSGESASIELLSDGHVEAIGRDVTRRLGLKGPFKIDLIRDPRNGRWLTMEVNARFNLWHELGAARGVNLPEVAYDYLVNRRTPGAPCLRPGPSRWVSEYRELKAWQELMSGNRLRTVWHFARSVCRRRTRREVFAWNDPLPLLVSLSRFLRALVHRWTGS